MKMTRGIFRSKFIFKWLFTINDDKFESFFLPPQNMTSQFMIKRITIWVLLPLIIGLLFYQLRPFGNGWIDDFKLESDALINFGKRLPDFLKYNFPDGLWAFAFTSAIQILWAPHEKSFRVFWLVVVFLVIALTEVLQKFEILNGVFDWLDLITMTFAFVSSILIFSKYEKLNT